MGVTVLIVGFRCFWILSSFLWLSFGFLFACQCVFTKVQLTCQYGFKRLVLTDSYVTSGFVILHSV